MAVGAATAAATVVVAFVDPHRPGQFGICPTLWLTGWYCPGCGALRATFDLAHLDLAAAWAMNPLWVLAVPVVAVVWAAWLRRAWRGTSARPFPGWLGVVLLVVLVLFGVLRNVPALASWLAPGGATGA
ncbi:Protein of unknown function [Sanguibacter gelidistatuariae]|uniref:DUF2752 domain-containing protein n=1 Tax=Sanguibacter gelidistatuariae TaxID=1814289 RepID=A0A1G6KW94_9MICO|nr:DUF2752 domain-containing protein [Sanguibacter gelidistatuariae]SDC35068.1 Protein of unknown function [Sanguibacter gelidistatuariae]